MLCSNAILGQFFVGVYLYIDVLIFYSSVSYYVHSSIVIVCFLCFDYLATLHELYSDPTGLRFEINKYRTKTPFRISSNYCHNGYLCRYPILAEQIGPINVDLTRRRLQYEI